LVDINNALATMLPPFNGTVYRTIWVSKHQKGKLFRFLQRDALQCKARSCYRMSSVRLSVCLSVTLVYHDQIGWKSWKLITRTITPTSSLFVAQRSSTYSQGNMAKFGGRLEVGQEKVTWWSIKAAISLKRVKTERRAYRKSPMLFWTVPSATPTTSSSPRLGFTTPTKTPITNISGTAKATHLKFSKHIQKLSGHLHIRHIVRHLCDSTAFLFWSKRWWGSSGISWIICKSLHFAPER